MRQARRDAALATFADAIARGEPLERAVPTTVSAMVDTGDWTVANSAWALAEGVGRWADGATASALGHGVLLHRRRQFDRAWTVLSALDDATLTTHVPVEAVDAALAAGTPEARRRALTIGSATAEMTAETLVDLAGRFLAAGEREHAATLMTDLRGRPDADLDEPRRHSRSLIERWLANAPSATSRRVDPRRRHGLPHAGSGAHVRHDGRVHRVVVGPRRPRPPDRPPVHG